MRTISKPVLVAVIGLLCFAGNVRSADTTAIGRLQSAQSGALYHGRPRVVLTVQTMDGKSLTIGVENTDEKKYMVDPKTELLDEIKALNPGDMVKVVYETQSDKTAMLRDITAYVMEPGMELPNAFVFVESYDHADTTTDRTLVDLKRFEKIVTVQVPGKKDASGNLTPDPELMAAIGKLTKDQIVLADAVPGDAYPILRSIEVYTPPKAGTLKAIKLGELNGNKTTEADIDMDGTAVTAFVPGHLDGKRWIVDSKILAELRRLRPNTPVLFRAVDDGSGNSLLRDIKAAPKPAAKPAARTAAADTSNR